MRRRTALNRSGPEVLILMLVATVLLQSAVPVFGVGPGYNPRVSPGQWARYGHISAVLYPPDNPLIPRQIADLLSVNSATITVQSVLGHDVSSEQILTYTNGTVRTQDLSENLLTGDGNLTYWILAGDLTTGDHFWNSSQTPVPNYTFNTTIPRIYLGVLRSVNPLNVTTVYPLPTGTARLKINAFWDQASGVLLELHIVFDVFLASVEITYGSVNAVIVDSNIFGASVRPDFFLYVSPVPIVAAPGATGIAEVVSVSVDNFAGNVSLAASFVGSDQAVATITPASVRVSPSGSDMATLMVNIGSTVTPREYAVNLTGTANGGLAHSILVPVQVIGDFSLAAPSNISIQTGKSDVAAISISLGIGFTSQVNLTVTGPTGITVQLARDSITRTGSIDLTITIASNLGPGDYTVTVKAIGGSQTHTKTISVTVTAPPRQPSTVSNLILGLEPTIFYAILVAIAAVIIIGGVSVVRMRRPPGSPAQDASSTVGNIC